MKLWVACLGLAIACTPSALGPNGYTHPKDQYRINASSSALLNNDWVLDSHYGSPNSYSPKSGSDYEVGFGLDVDGDGEVDKSTTLPLYDLRWEHAVNSGVLWTRTVPIPEKLARKAPRVLLLNYIERIAGSGVAAVTYDGALTVRVVRYGTKILKSGPAVVGRQSGFAAEIEVVNLDQHELDQSSPRHKIKLVLVHNPKPVTLRFDLEYSCVMLAAYSSQPEDYPKQLSDFEELLSKIDFGAGTSKFQDDLEAWADGPSETKQGPQSQAPEAQRDAVQ